MTEHTVAPSRHAVAHEQGLPAWRMFLLAHSLITRRLDEELRERQGLSLAEYDALLQLAESPGRRLRMSQLADRVLLSRSGVTRLVDRLEADRLVSRQSCTSDARGAEAVLTEAGLSRLRDASGTHLRGVARYFLTVLEPQELEALGGALGQIVQRIVTDEPASEADGHHAAVGDDAASSDAAALLAGADSALGVRDREPADRPGARAR